MSEIRVSILGFGTVGQALATLLEDAHDSGIRIVSATDGGGSIVNAAGLHPRALLDAKAVNGTIAREPHDAAWIVEHVDADVVVDLLPTNLKTAEPSHALALAAFRRKKHVVTAGKGALALHERALRDAAAHAGVQLRASAAVCAGTPVLELLHSAFRGDHVERFDAVLNGSTNFILTRISEGATFEEALAEARHDGIIEADPSLDLLGLDAAAKTVILANAAWGPRFTLDDVKTEGVVGVTTREAAEARAAGFALRLVASASPAGGLKVAPVALPRDHPLVTEGTLNAVRLRMKHAGTVTVRGPGAGGTETAAAVLSDLVGLRTIEGNAASRHAAAAAHVAP